MPTFVKLLKTFKIEFFSLVILGIILMAAFFFIVHHAGHQQFDSVKINLAGRQRMLSQKLAKELFLFKEDKVNSTVVHNTITVFDKTLVALTNGGPAPLDLEQKEYRTLPAMDVPETKEKLLSVIALWSVLKENALCVLAAKDDECLTSFIKENNHFLDLINNTVFMMQETSENNNSQSQFMIYLAFTLIILLLGVLVVRETCKLSEAVNHIDKLENFLPICSHCKRIRLFEKDAMEMSSWVVMEEYFRDEKEISFSHGICPSCALEFYPDYYGKIRK